jgi:tight adherence protein C
MILFFLPVLFVVILGPAIINVEDTFNPHGKPEASSSKR